MVNILRLLRTRSPILTLNGIILKEDKILLVRRAIPPFRDFWVLPGGHVKYGETIEEGIKRETKEELGISPKIKKLIGIYSNPRRHPYYHAVAIIYFLENIGEEVILNFESSEFNYFSFKSLPSQIGFDHREIIKDFFQTYIQKEGKY